MVDIISEKYDIHKTILMSDTFPNMLFYGFEETGKKLIIDNLYTTDDKTKHVDSFVLNNKEVSFTFYKSSKYIEIDLGEIILHKDKFLKKIIKRLSKNRNIFSNDLNIIIIRNIDTLNKNEQFILRKIIEDTYDTCRFILLAKTINNLIEPIISRCLCLRFEGFGNKELKDIIKKNYDSDMSKILKNNNNNLKDSIYDYKALLNRKDYENEKYNKGSDNKNKTIKSIVTFIKSKTKVSNTAIKKMNDNIVLLYRDMDMSYTEILKHIFKVYTKGKYSPHVITKLLEYENRVKTGSKGIIHIQGFIFYLKADYNN